MTRAPCSPNLIQVSAILMVDCVNEWWNFDNRHASRITCLFITSSRIAVNSILLGASFFVCLLSTTVATCQPRDSLKRFIYLFFIQVLWKQSWWLLVRRPGHWQWRRQPDTLIFYFFASTFHKPDSFPDSGRRRNIVQSIVYSDKGQSTCVASWSW